MKIDGLTGVVSLPLLLGGCGNGKSIAGPTPDVAGTWSVVRTVVSSEGCEVLLLPTPIEMAIREVDFSAIEVDVPLSAGAVLTLVGMIESDGDFEVGRVIDEPGFSHETIVVKGSFTGDAFSGIQTSDSRYFAPELIELLGSDHCRSVIRWEGERV